MMNDSGFGAKTVRLIEVLVGMVLQMTQSENSSTFTILNVFTIIHLEKVTM